MNEIESKASASPKVRSMLALPALRASRILLGWLGPGGKDPIALSARLDKFDPKL